MFKALFATHPSLESRIQRLWPSLDIHAPLTPRPPTEFVAAMPNEAMPHAPNPTDLIGPAIGLAGVEIGPLQAAIDQSNIQHWLWALLLATEAGARNQQLNQLNDWFGRDATGEIQELSASWLSGHPERRLAALNLVAARLRHQTHHGVLEQALILISLDRHIEPFELAAYQLVLANSPRTQIAQRPAKSQIIEAVATLLAWLAAHTDHPDLSFDNASRTARTYWPELPARDLPQRPTAARLLPAINVMTQASSDDRRALLISAAQCDRANPELSAGLKALSEALGCPAAHRPK